ncbi:MAG: hypothetical protein GEU88_17245 [Solirubrobacterales bacterium]|nr:hypothetical protein [Solirubrobacterales bacterium]
MRPPTQTVPAVAASGGAEAPPPRWLEGPGLCEWLERSGAVLRPDVELDANMARNWRRWEAGGHADVYTVDRLLCGRGVHLSEVPDELWRTRRPYRRRRRVAARERERAARRHLAGAPARQVAGELGVSERAVRNWANALRGGSAP